MNNYKIIASDLDGTLLDSKGLISRENLDAIDKLISMSIHFVPCSGRTYSELPSQLKENKSIRYVIHSNGATVLDRKTGVKILNCISNTLVGKILDILHRYETHITYRFDGNCFVDARFQGENFWDYYNVCDAHRRVVSDYAIYLDDFDQKSRSADNVEVFAAFFHDRGERLECIKELKKVEHLQVVELDENNVEVVSSTAGKGNALCALAQHLGIDISDTMSLGDSGNDITITQTAGLGLAMSNASDSLKAVADGIICHNDEHAVKYILEHYFL